MAQKCIDIVPIYQSQPGKFLSQILDLIKYDFVFFSSTIDVFSNKRRREIKQKSGLSWELQKEQKIYLTFIKNLSLFYRLRELPDMFLCIRTLFKQRYKVNLHGIS